jgi:hypothetical protein
MWDAIVYVQVLDLVEETRGYTVQIKELIRTQGPLLSEFVHYQVVLILRVTVWT